MFFPEADFIAGLPAARQCSTAGSARCREPVLRPLSCPPRSGGAAPQPRCATGAMRHVWSENASLPSCPPPLLRSASLFFVLYTLCRRLYLIRRPCFFVCGNSALFFFPFFLYNDSTSVNTRLYPNGTDEYRRE